MLVTFYLILIDYSFLIFPDKRWNEKYRSNKIREFDNLPKSKQLHLPVQCLHIQSDHECRGNLRICKFVCSFQNRKLHRKHDDFMKSKHEPKIQMSYIQREVYGNE